MGTKLEKDTFPAGHGPNDFKCFGPAATKDGIFDGTMICDMGCFTQESVDSNKFYHAAAIQSTKNQKWYTYFEWGRTGASKPAFQMVECSSKEDAMEEYCDQLHSKNDKRGEWFQHPALGRILRAKAGKDCYLVRSQAKRSTGLPDARTIVQNEGAKPTPIQASSSSSAPSKPRQSIDSQTVALMRDLNLGTINYTRSVMADAAVPTQSAIDEARAILDEAKKQVVVVGDSVDNQVADRELQHLTTLMYGRIPKKKDRNAPPSVWILSGSNIYQWTQDLDAFESALKTGDAAQQEVDPFGGMNMKMRWLSPKDPVGEFLYNWAPTATRGRHSYLGSMKLYNIWEIERNGDRTKIKTAAASIAAQDFRVVEKPMFQPKRPDLEVEETKLFIRSNTCLMFHGTRSVNVSGLLRESWRPPKQLAAGVVITGSFLGDGVYIADDWAKSAGYTSLHNSYYSHGSGSISNRHAFMFIADVVLGNMFVAPSGHGYSAPPRGYHSVFGKGGHTKTAGWGGGVLQNNEFVIYNPQSLGVPSQIAMRYLIEFSA